MSDDSTNLRQEFVTELESILESDEAYGSNLQILTYTLKEDVINGKFKDSWNNRVYEFIVDIDGISYKPAAKLDSFSTDELPTRFDAYSKGYTSLFENERLDRNPVGKRVKKPKCGNQGYGCGYSCISLLKTCQILSSGKKAGTNQGKAIGQQRLNKLMELSKKLYLAGDTKKATLASAIAANISKVRTKYNAGGQGLIAERALAKQQVVAKKPESIKSVTAAKLSPKSQEKKLTKPKSEPTTSSKTLIVDQEIFKVKFPSKEVQREYGLGGVIDRAESVIDFIKNPKTFSKMPASEQAGVLDNLTTVHGIGNKNWDEQLKMPMIASNEERRLGAEAANVRAQGAKQIWDNLNNDEKTKLTASLKELGSNLTNKSDEFENKYVNQLASEIRKLAK